MTDGTQTSDLEIEVHKFLEFKARGQEKNTQFVETFVKATIIPLENNLELTTFFQSPSKFSQTESQF